MCRQAAWAHTAAVQTLPALLQGKPRAWSVSAYSLKFSYDLKNTLPDGDRKEADTPAAWAAVGEGGEFHLQLSLPLVLLFPGPREAPSPAHPGPGCHPQNRDGIQHCLMVCEWDSRHQPACQLAFSPPPCSSKWKLLQSTRQVPWCLWCLAPDARLREGLGACAVVGILLREQGATFLEPSLWSAARVASPALPWACAACCPPGLL